jgi:hypothetical protein
MSLSDDLFPNGEDVAFQVHFLDMALRQALSSGRVKNKTDFSRIVFVTSGQDPLATMNQCRRFKENGEPERRMSLREAMRAAKLADRMFSQFCWDVENKMRAGSTMPVS